MRADQAPFLQNYRLTQEVTMDIAIILFVVLLSLAFAGMLTS
jgi:hypothetical protein